ncbi:MAG TPA: L-aspartate oxidase, partial [Synergistaceae bacterium]|nr:L-aspartate oxidase [Synergistaceae bacterium]
ATGGIGGLFERSTNFSHLTGDALAIAIKHGIKIKDINYIQVHPTSLYTEEQGRAFLISEAVRGEGAVLIDREGNRFTDELQPRDVVTKKIYEQMEKDKMPYV